MTEFLKTIHWSTLAQNWGIGLIKIILLLLAYFIVKSIGKKYIDRSFERIKKQKDISVGRAHTLEKLTANIFSYTLFFAFIVFLFDILNYSISALLAGAGVVGLAIGFGAQGLVSDFVTGFFILLEQQVDVGEYVTVGGIDGIVEEVGLRTTKLRGFDGTLHFIPNRQINTLSNHSRGTMRALVDISIGYDKDMDHAISVIQGVCDQLASETDLIVEGPSVLGVQSLGNSDVVLRVIAKTVNMEQWGIERELRKRIKEALG